MAGWNGNVLARHRIIVDVVSLTRCGAAIGMTAPRRFVRVEGAKDRWSLVKGREENQNLVPAQVRYKRFTPCAFPVHGAFFSLTDGYDRKEGHGEA